MRIAGTKLTSAQLTIVAMACHEINRAYCVSLGDTSQKCWEDTPNDIKNSARIGVTHALSGADPYSMHMKWCETKVDDGWVYGEVKDPVAKTHPCLKPYDELPVAQRMKDHLFIETVWTMVDAIL